MSGSSTSPSNPFLSLLDYAEQPRYARDAEVRSALIAMSSTPPGIREFYGLPGMGKSTLLSYLADLDRVVDHNRESLLGNFREHPEKLFPVLVRFAGMPAATHPLALLYETFRETWDRRDRFAEHILPPFQQTDGLTGAMASAWLDRDVRKLHAAGIRPVFLLDDFDVAFHELTKAETTALRPLKDYACFILVTEQSLIDVNQGAAGSPFIQSVTPIYVSGLLDDEAFQLVNEMTTLRKVTFPSQEIELLIKYSGGHPYLLILAGKALWEMRELRGLLDAGDELLGEPWITGVIGQLEKEYRRTFLLYSDKLDNSEKQMLKMIAARHDSQVRGRAERLQMDELQIQTAFDLARKGLLKQDIDAGYRLFSPLFEKFALEMLVEHESASKEDPDLSDLEASLHSYLKSHAGEACSYGDLWDAAWNTERPHEHEKMKHILSVTISRLRKKLSLAGVDDDIYSLRDFGYRYEPR